MAEAAEKYRLAYDEMQVLKQKGLERKEIIDKLVEKYDIALSTFYEWYRGKMTPWGRKGKLSEGPELAYVIGALLGDGCPYKWKCGYNYVTLSGSRAFCEKFARRVNSCSDIKSKAYPNRSQNVWFVRINHYELYNLFKDTRKDLSALLESLERKKCAIAFIEGFFDAEGCVKVVGKKLRRNPKICLDICNTDKRYLDLIKHLFKKHLNIKSFYSNQEAYMASDGSPRKKSYHLRIYKKAAIRTFFEHISTTKLKNGKENYLDAWLNNGY